MTDEKPVLIDPDNTRFKGAFVWAIVGVVITGAITVFVYLLGQAEYKAEMKAAYSMIQQTIVLETQARERDRIDRERVDNALIDQLKEMKNSTDIKLSEIKTELVRMNLDTVPGRDATTWIEKARLSFKAWVAKMQADNPTLKMHEIELPDMPR